MADLQIFHEASTIEFWKFDISQYKNFCAFLDHMRETPELKEVDDLFKSM